VHIEQIRPELTWLLRREVLYPDQALAAMQMPVDADGVHFGAFKNDLLVGVVSLFQTGTIFQFRKFAVAENQQNQGIGTGILQYIINFCQQQQGSSIWCNARISAIQFYEKSGFAVAGQPFEQNDKTYVKMEKSIILKAGLTMQTSF